MGSGGQAPYSTPPEGKNWPFPSWASPYSTPLPPSVVTGHYWSPDLNFIQTDRSDRGQGQGDL